MVTWKDNFDAFYSEVAELGRYDVKSKAPSATVRLLIIPRLISRVLPSIEVTVLSVVLVTETKERKGFF